MGMFDKDKQYGLRMNEKVARGEEFILWAATVSPDTITTSFGEAEQGIMEISKLAEPRNRSEVRTIHSAIVEKFKEQEAGDLPAIVFWTEIPDARKPDGGTITVLRFVKPYGETQAPRENPEAQTPPGPR